MIKTIKIIENLKAFHYNTTKLSITANLEVFKNKNLQLNEINPLYSSGDLLYPNEFLYQTETIKHDMVTKNSVERMLFVNLLAPVTITLNPLKYFIKNNIFPVN